MMWRTVVGLSAALAGVACNHEHGLSPKSASLSAALAPRPDSVVTGVQIGKYYVHFDSNDTFAAVESRLGNTLTLRAKHHDDIDQICYRTSTRSATTYLLLQSDELGGPDRAVLGYRVTDAKPPDLEPSTCVWLPANVLIIASNGAQLGMTEDSLLAATGWSRSSTGDYKSSYDDGRYAVVQSLSARVREGNVIDLSAWYVRVN
jgi:hypothetical protein